MLTTCRRETVYLLRAYELDKTQPLVNLTLATAYIQRAMSRKTDNRQHQIAQVRFGRRLDPSLHGRAADRSLAQAFAFLDQYRRARGPSPETEYNLARAFHHIGMLPLSYALSMPFAVKADARLGVVEQASNLTRSSTTRPSST